MENQRGAALVIVLSMLAMTLVLGLSGMQSSLVEERLAGNYKAAVEAQMNAESVASEIFSIINEGRKDIFVTNGDVFQSELAWAEFSALAESNSGSCQSYSNRVACYVRLTEAALGLSGGDYIFAIGSVVNDDVVVSESLPVVVEVESRGLIRDAEAAVTCVGATCEFFAKNPPTVIDGRDYYANVDTKGSISSNDVNPSGFNKAAYIVPDGNVALGNSSVTGEKIESAEDYENYEGLDEKWSSAEARVKEDIDRLVQLGKEGDGRITYFGQDSGGGVAMPSSGIVVVDNVDLFMDVPGNFKFTGLVVVRHGSLNFSAPQGAGTIAVVGAVIAYNSTVNMQNGNPAVLYSSEALNNVGATSGSDGLSIRRWL
ncbi:PilX N-terminal domain-containing pilus assembly protein [Marinobacter sp. TBZ242]|uniref:PilX N-terminal domain-containing pilus assembly protein n=1 Tax=Marinobacter azerbaijanicus TaxID=3050455 RepID=A0ABT7IIR2_9GAMM|nr:PilX N-terminal domain-containing pilus assembly protein [Marinobacter sp. TBZ242]MDL0434072.1 PilX N-terminal domain-containing pilus assembly protein [Marinobacter sp. TBZ242]